MSGLGHIPGRAWAEEPAPCKFTRLWRAAAAQCAAANADTLGVNIVLFWLAVASAAVLLVALAVAWWEHRRRVADRAHDPAWSDTEIDIGALAGAAEVDLALDTHHTQPAHRLNLSDEEREQAARQAVLAAALSRMARHKAEPTQRNAWADTQPLINAAPTAQRKTPAGSAVE